MADTSSEEHLNLLASDGSTQSSVASKRICVEPTTSRSTEERAKLLKEPKNETGDDEVSRSRKKTEDEDDEPVTDWRAIVVCAVVYFFIATILQAINVVAYMYLKKIDSTVLPVYSGLHIASVKMGHALGTIIFAVYAYTSKCFKKTLLIGRAASFIALLLYLIILLFPEHYRRFVFLVAFFFQSFAEGSLIVVRSFVPRVSSSKDRQAAYGVISGAMMFSILAGPGIQVAASALPTVELAPWLHLAPFTYPIWIGLVLCLIATVLICFCMTEHAPIRETAGSPSQASFRVQMATALDQLAGMDKVALGFVYFEKIVTSFCFSSMLSAFTPLMEAILNMNKDDGITYVAGSQCAVGIISILTVLVFVFTPLGKGRASPLLFFSLTCYALMYFYSYPWPPIAQPITTKSAENPYGCDATELEWCAHQWHVKIWYWLPVVALLFGMAVPTAMISTDTVYSKLLGNIDQNLMQGALVIVDDLASSVAPIVTTKIYTWHGPAVFWLVLGGNALVGFLAWLPMVPKMRRLKM